MKNWFQKGLISSLGFLFVMCFDFVFVAASQVVFNRDLLITHMVSPEGEKLELVETIDPKKQSVEAWLLELEGKMRLTVRVLYVYCMCIVWGWRSETNLALYSAPYNDCLMFLKYSLYPSRLPNGGFTE